MNGEGDANGVARPGEDFGELLRAFRARRTWTQTELASHASVSVRTVNGLESGRARPRLATARMLADALGLGEADRDRFLASAQGQPPSATEPAARGQPVPAQLPADPVDFVGRARELSTLDAVLPFLGGGATVSVLTGSAGVGKTALALHWAHRVAARFGDGQLYANLRGFAPGAPMRPVEVLAGFLAALGVPADRIPVREDPAAALYRSLSAERRMLVVLDNAADADQVRPLLPSGRDSLVVVTSRRLLTGLIVSHGAHHQTLAPLTAADAGALVTAILGAERTAAERDALAALTQACARLPLALRIAAANVRTDRHVNIRSYVDELRHGDRLGFLDIDGDPTASVRGAFDWSYARLPDAARRLFRHLGLVPGPGISLEAAAALTGATMGQTSRWLRSLTDAHLLERQPNQLYAFHDLLRAYATEQSHDTDSPAERDAARRRLLDWYLASATNAAEVLFPTILRLPKPEHSTDIHPIEPTDRTTALAWLATERRNLVAAVTHAAASGMPEHAWRLGDVLRGYFDNAGHLVDWLSVAHAALAAATAEGDLAARSAAASNLAHAHHYGGDFDAAIEHSGTARALAARAGWLAGEARALNHLAVLYADGVSLDRATELFTEALELDRRSGNRTSEAQRLMNLGVCASLSGRLAEAEQYLRRALDIPGTAMWRYTSALPNLGVVQRLQGSFDDAADTLAQALAAGKRDGVRRAFILTVLADLALDRGRFREGGELADSAEAIARDTGDRRNRLWAIRARAASALRQHRPDEAATHYERLLEVAGERGFLAQRASAFIGLAQARRHLGQLDAAGAHAARALAWTESNGYRVYEGEAHTALADIELDQHRAGHDTAALERAAGHAVRALELQRDTGHRVGEVRSLIVLSDILFHSGRLAEAAGYRREAIAVGTRLGLPETADLAP